MRFTLGVALRFTTPAIEKEPSLQLAPGKAWKAWWKTCVRLFQSFHNGGDPGAKAEDPLAPDPSHPLWLRGEHGSE